jgi:putative FmdB family regulatory protein
MPMYEYQCHDCEHSFETLVFDDQDPVECPECHGHKLEQLLSLPGKGRVQGEGLPMNCNPNLPPCGPGCCRLP